MEKMTLEDAQRLGLDLLQEWWKAYKADDFKQCKKIIKSLKALDALVEKPRQKEQTR
jgi:hypothetical protein